MAPSTAETTTSWASFYDSSLEKSRLPHYEDLQQIDHCGVSELPPPKATPTEVSDFLFQLLVSTKAMSSEDQARDVAARWKLGTGQELRDYPAIMFLDIFGKEEGFVTYREVKRVMNKKKDESFGHRFGMYIVLVLVLCCEAIAISVARSGLMGDAYEKAFLVSVLGGLVSFFVLVCAFLRLCVIDHELTANFELKNALNGGECHRRR